MDPFEHLPDELIVLHALELPLDEITNICEVSRRFAHLVCSNENFWRQRFAQDYGFVPEIIPLSWRNLYREYSAVHGPPNLTRRPRVPTPRSFVVAGQSGYRPPLLFNEDLLRFFANANLGPIVEGDFTIGWTGRDTPDESTLRVTRQPLNSVLFFTQPTILGQPNPLYGITSPNALMSLFVLHAFYANMRKPGTPGRLASSPEMRKYLGRFITFNPDNFVYVNFNSLIDNSVTRNISPEELEVLIPEITRVYQPLFPNLPVITPNDILGYQQDMITLARAYTDK